MQTRDFFKAFFTLSDFHWHGFLSTRLSFFQLVGFGLALFVNASNSARGNLLAQGIPGEPNGILKYFSSISIAALP